GYGDCKDKATLLVALLRQAGVKASVALLDSGFGLDIDRDLPGIGVFDHAIVYLHTDPPIWIDATARQVRVGYLPPADEGRLALIADPSTQALVRIPESDSSRNTQLRKIEVRMASMGPGKIVETVEATGSFEAELRSTYASGETKSRESAERWVKQYFRAKSLGTFDSASRDDLSGPFHMQVEGVGSKIAATSAVD